MNKFQLIIIIIFILFAFAGVLFFATFRSGTSEKDVKLTLWGDVERIVFNRFLEEFKKNTERAYDITYKEIDEDDFFNEVINAVAEGGGPDLVLFSSNDLLKFEDKILTIPYEFISERGFKDAFVEGSEIFLSKEGVLALPWSIDPLVMYWNRDILQGSGISKPPEFWSELFTFASRVTDKDEALNIRRSAVALGEFGNIKNAKAILLSLLFQSGNEVIERNDADGSPRVVFSDSSGNKAQAAESVLNFYTEFSNPSKTSYSWNRSLPNSLESFISGDLALYFGFASELPEIRAKNPNLNFDVALFPQLEASDSKSVFGEIKGLAVLRRSPNAAVALSALSTLVRADNITSLSEITGLPPVRRDLLSKLPGLSFESLFYQSALFAQAFLDPGFEETNNLFQDLIDRIVSGRERVSQAIRRFTVNLSALVLEN